MYNPNIPLNIMRHRELTWQQKAFLLWAWSCRETNDRCIVTSNRQDCAVRDLSIQFYADLFGVSRPNLSTMFTELREKNIMKIEYEGSRNEITFVDFTIFC